MFACSDVLGLVKKHLELQGYSVYSAYNTHCQLMAHQGNVTLCVNLYAEKLTPLDKEKGREYAEHVHGMYIGAKLKTRLLDWPTVEYYQIV